MISIIIMSKMLPTWWWLLASAIVLLLSTSSTIFKPIVCTNWEPTCSGYWDLERHKSENGCKGGNKDYPNVPTLDGVYCFNNGTGICKAFAGRFEFYFNSWNRTILGPAPAGQFNDAYGYHSRVPISYNVKGEVVYADRAINWARHFTSKQTEPAYNLMNSQSFNWCKYADKDNWPYKTAFLDHDNKTHIYFHNRQSCVTNDPESPQPEHINSRFVHNSTLRIDLDYNPTMFAMEDDLAGEIRLVKHLRQHWYEVGWEMLRDTNSSHHYVKFADAEQKPCRIDSETPRLFTQDTYKQFTNLCVSDYFTTRSGTTKNNVLMGGLCGLDRVEIADYIDAEFPENKMLEVYLHGLPDTPKRSCYFYEVECNSEKEWQEFAHDGITFSANTLIKMNTTDEGEDSVTFNAYTMFSEFGDKNPPDKYDQYYPHTEFKIRSIKIDRKGSWKDIQRITGFRSKYINHIDDIAWLPKCDTILLIFGPLYTEFKPNIGDFNLKTKNFLGPIYNLGLNEMTSAFFAREDKLYFYHRLNYVAEHKYTCGERGAKTSEGYVDLARALVTAQRVGGYRPRAGGDMFDFMAEHMDNIKPYYHTEERFFKNLQVFKGEISNVEAPDVTQYPYDPDREVDPERRKLPTGVWVVIGLAVLALLILLLLGMITVRRIVKKRHLMKTIRSGMSNTGRSRFGEHATDRSGLSESPPSPASGSRQRSTSRSTLRSGMTGRGGGAGGHHSTSRSNRSSLSANKKSPLATAASSRQAGSSASPSRSKVPSSSTVRSARLSTTATKQ